MPVKFICVCVFDMYFNYTSYFTCFCTKLRVKYSSVSAVGFLKCCDFATCVYKVSICVKIKSRWSDVIPVYRFALLAWITMV